MRAFIAAALMVVGLSTSAVAEPKDVGPAIDQAMTWISANTDYRLTERPRFISMMTAKQIADMAANSGFASGNTVAMYDCASGTMFLNAEVDYEKNLWNRGVLVHELVHHVQCTTHRGGNLCGKETEAYALQVKYLHQNLPDSEAGINLKKRQTAWAERVTGEMCSRY